MIYHSWFAQIPPAHREKYTQWAQALLIFASVVLLIALGTLGILYKPWQESRQQLQLSAGQVAPRDILAPRSLTYASAILTERSRQAASSTITPIYEPQPQVTRDQINYAKAVSSYIHTVRHDPYASSHQKILDLQAIASLKTSPESWASLLSLSENRWELIRTELPILVERTMQREIRVSNLDSARNLLVNSVPARFSSEEAALIVAIAWDIIQPNTFLNDPLTQQRQNEAAAQVIPQEVHYEQGQLIVREGNLVTETELEALKQFGFLDSRGLPWHELMGAILGVGLCVLSFGVYLQRFEPALLRQPQLITLIACLFLLTLFSLNIFDNEAGRQRYLYPAPAMGLLLSSLFSPHIALTASIFLALLMSLALPAAYDMEMAAYVMVGSLAGILTLRHNDRLNSYFVAGLVIGLAHTLVMLIFRLMDSAGPLGGEIFVSAMVTFASGLFAAGMALVGLYIISSVTNLTTHLKLMELMDFKHDLLQKLLRQAPGTYQHSLQVANLCELAAQAIGANAQLIRVAAMYHDIGKTLDPIYFGENAPEGVKPHDQLNDPYKSAKIILAHVIEGEKMARRAHLPPRIRDFILEHHGTTKALYFYNQALDQAEKTGQSVREEDFRYPGPAPRSRETAIMMLADGCESAARSVRPSSKEEVEKVVNTIFELRLGEGQLDDSGLTLYDLKVIRQTFIETLQAMYHPRIPYQNRVAPPDTPSSKLLATGFVRAALTEASVMEVGQRKSIVVSADGALREVKSPSIPPPIEDNQA
jgi:putative nucleotidyltransferase with HDIG domain